MGRRVVWRAYEVSDSADFLVKKGFSVFFWGLSGLGSLGCRFFRVSETGGSGPLL